jgi:hypothetical protein
MHARACFFCFFFSHKKWEYQTCGAGVVIKNVSSGSFIAVEDLQGVHLEANVEVVTGDFPTCWEMEVMDNGNAEGGEDENGDVYARYVGRVVVRPCCASLLKPPFSLLW